MFPWLSRAEMQGRGEGAGSAGVFLCPPWGPRAMPLTSAGGSTVALPRRSGSPWRRLCLPRAVPGPCVQA